MSIPIQKTTANNALAGKQNELVIFYKKIPKLSYAYRKHHATL